MNRTCCVAAALAVACAPRASQVPPAPPPTDLWSFAPGDVEVSVVARDGSLGMLTRALRTGMRYWESADPDGAAAGRARFGADPIARAFLDDEKLAEHGIDVARGFALYARRDDYTLVLPVGDRERFRASLGAAISISGTYEVDHLGRYWCAELRRRYVCTTKLERLPDLDAHPAPVPGWTREGGGDVEAVIAGGLLQKVDATALAETGLARLTNLRAIHVSARVEPGAVTARMHFVGDDASLPRPPWPAVARLGAGAPAALGLIRSDKLRDQLKASRGGALVADEWTGDLLLSVPSGDRIAVLARLRYRDAAHARAPIARCEELLGGPPTQKSADRCARSVAFPPVFAGSLEATAEDADLVLGIREAGFGGEAAPAAAPRSLRELLAGAPTLILWARGIFALGGTATPAGSFGPSRADTLLWFVSHVAEIGLAFEPRPDGAMLTGRLRTTFANPDELVPALEPLLYRAVRGDVAAAEQIRTLAARYPSSPLATDVASGTGAMRAVAIAAAMVGR